MRVFIRTIMLALLLVVVAARGQDAEMQWPALAGISGVTVVAEPLSAELVERGITAEDLEARIRLRLREAGVTVLDPGVRDPAPGNPTLYLQLTAILTPGQERCTYSIRLDLLQTARLERDETLPLLQVPTWGVNGIARHGRGWRQAIIDDVIVYTDAFVSALVAANPTRG